MSNLVLTILIAVVACRTAQQKRTGLATFTLALVALLIGLPGRFELNYVVIAVQLTLDVLICLLPMYAWVMHHHKREFARFLTLTLIPKGPGNDVHE